MMMDILSTNRDEVLRAVDVYMAQLQRLADLVSQVETDEVQLRAALEFIRSTRKEQYP
jgi:prephenate dehydrogenase